MSTVAHQAIDEWMRTQDHVGIVFRYGPAGRRAGLFRGPDVWEVAAILGEQQGTPDERVAAAATQMGIDRRDVEAAAAYWADFRQEVDAQVRANEEAADRELAAWEQRRALLGA